VLCPPLLSFTSVYFFELGLFNGLQPIQTKFSVAPQALSKTVDQDPARASHLHLFQRLLDAMRRIENV
jgi:hypothetical protein